MRLHPRFAAAVHNAQAIEAAGIGDAGSDAGLDAGSDLAQHGHVTLANDYGAPNYPGGYLGLLLPAANSPPLADLYTLACRCDASGFCDARVTSNPVHPTQAVGWLSIITSSG